VGLAQGDLFKGVADLGGEGRANPVFDGVGDADGGRDRLFVFEGDEFVERAALLDGSVDVGAQLQHELQFAGEDLASAGGTMAG